MNPAGIDANESVAYRSSGRLRLIRLRQYALAILSVGVALGASLALEHFHFRVPSALLLLFAVAISSWYGGRGPALLAFVLSTISFYWYFVEPVRTIYIYRSEIPFFIVFTAFAALLSWFGTVRRRGEGDLRERADLLNLTHDTVFVMDIKGVIKYWNRAAEEQYGWTAEQALGRVVHNLLKTVFPAPLDEIKAEVTRTGRWEGELLHTKKDGTQVMVASRWSFERDKRGEPVAILETNNDITERKQAEREVSLLSSALNKVHDAAFLSDANACFHYVNEEACRALGYARAELLAMSVPDIDLQVPAERWPELWLELKAKRTLTFESRHRTRDGRIFPVEIRGNYFEYGGGAYCLALVTDITERKRAEDALRQSEAYLAEAERISHSGSWAWNPAAGDIRYWSKGCYPIMGFDPAEGLPSLERFLERIHPEDLPRLRERLQGVAREKTNYEDEYRIVRPSGEVRDLRVIGHPVFDSAGNLVEYVGTTADVTDRKRSEEALRRSEAYLSEAQRLSHTGSWALDVASDKYVYVSEECLRIYGFDPQQGLPSRDAVFRRIHPEDLDRVRAIFEKSLREKVDTSDELRIVLPDGAIKHLQVTRRPVLNETGHVVRLVGTSVDITERKRAEEALRLANAYNRGLIEASLDPLVTIGPDGKITDVNAATESATGRSRGELIGTDFCDYFTEPANARAGYEQVFREGLVRDYPLELRHRDGRVMSVSYNAAVYRDESGEVVGVFAAARDITERLQAEEQREKLRQLEAEIAHLDRLSMLGELTASIAHEVNQPLSGVVSNGSACLRWLAGETPNMEEAREAVRRIVRDGKRAAEVVARVRALTKRTAASREKLDVNETIRDVLALVGDEAKKNSVTIRTEFADDVFPVLGDRVQLQQVLLNLVMNGVEAMSNVGENARELAITTRNVDPNQVQVTVQDSGIGVELDRMPRIFEPFYTTKPHGMGMGLAICRSILQAHGGRLWAAVNDGPGTSFHFTLPRHEAESNAAA